MKNFFFAIALLLSVPGVAAAQEPAVSRLTDTDAIRWDTSLSLPPPTEEGGPNIGLAGVFAGFVGGELLVAGGANFPEGTPAEGGVKRYHADTYVYDAASGWRLFPDNLPEARAYGVAVGLPDGILCIGGCDERRCTADVRLLTLENGAPVLKDYPSLPRPLAHAAGCRIGDRIYVAGGIGTVDDARTTSDFFVLDLHRLDRGWSELAPWPGPSRAFAVAAAQSDGFDNCFYLFSGREFAPGEPWNVLDDGYEYNPRLDRWRRLEGSFPVMAGTALPFGTNMLGGRSATNGDEAMLRLYHTVTGSTVETRAPEGVTLPVTTQLLATDDGLLVASGEVAPGVRTPVLLRGRIERTVHRLKAFDITVIVLYFCSLAFIGWYFSRNQNTSDDYFRGGGRIPWFVVGLSIFGTALSAITFMAIPAKAYATDWSYLLFNAGIVLCVPVIVLLFIPFYRRLNVTTAYEYLEARFNAVVRILCSIAFILFQIGRMGVVLLLPSIALNVVTGFDIFLCIALMGLLSLAYTLMGGIEAVAWTEALQVVVLLGAAVAVLVTVALQLPEGVGASLAAASGAGKFDLGSLAFDLRQPTMWTVLIATLFTNITTYGTDQTIVQRYLTTCTEREARTGLCQRGAHHSGHDSLLPGRHGAVGLLPPLPGAAEHVGDRQRCDSALVHEHAAARGTARTGHRRTLCGRHVHAQQQHELGRHRLRHRHLAQAASRPRRRADAARRPALDARAGRRGSGFRPDDGLVGDQVAVGRVFQDPRNPAGRSGRPVPAGAADAAGQLVRGAVRHRGQRRRADRRGARRLCQPAALFDHRFHLLLRRGVSGESGPPLEGADDRRADDLRRARKEAIGRRILRCRSARPRVLRAEIL